MPAGPSARHIASPAMRACPRPTSDPSWLTSRARAMADDNTPWDEMANAPGGPPKEGPTVVNFAAEKAKRADPKARKSQFFTATMLDGKEVPPRNWLVPGTIPSGTVTLLTGDGGTGKSLLALQLATACALGKRWLGKTVAGGR